jgi:ABC-type multidrug transport system fused ATPase/permease subunit
MERSLFKFILRFSLRQQLFIMFMTALSFPITYVTLELPKRIVNEALGEKPGWARGILGADMERITFLLALCFAFLLFVLISGAQKYHLNVYAGRLGEQMLRRLRFQLYARILRFPLPHFKKVSQGEIIPMVIAETDPIGGYIGEAWSIPAYQGGTLLVYLVFIFVQDLWLGLAAISLYPAQFWLIPKLQAKVNLLAKERVRGARQLSDKIGESISGIAEIHAHDTSRYERADAARRLGRIYEIRYDIFKRKFFIKFLNNFLAQLTPFFFYAIGGYFVIRAVETNDPSGLTLGALVAVLAAYKDLSSPWKELLTYYQQKEDVRIKYEQVMEQFDPPGVLDEKVQDEDPAPDFKLAGPLVAANVSYSEDGRVKSVEGVTFSLPLDKHAAVLGAGGSGKEELMMMLGRLLEPTSGTIQLGGHKLAQLPESVTGRRAALVGASPYLFATTVRDNLFYGLKHRPLKAPKDDDEYRRERARYAAEAEVSGNIPDDYAADWIDYAAAGAPDLAALERRALEVLTLVDMDDDMYQLGLRGVIDPKKQPELAAEILKARRALRERLAREDQAALIEPFDVGRYNDNATLGENLLFGTATDERLNPERLADQPYVLGVLDMAGVTDDLLGAARQTAATMVELFAGLAPGNELFEQYSFIAADELPEYQVIVGRTANLAPKDFRAEDRRRLLSLLFKVVAARHRLGVITDDIKAKVMEARRRFAAELPEDLKGAVEFFDADTYNKASTLLDNVLFGKVAFGQAQAQTKLARFVRATLDELSLSDDVMLFGLDFPVGVAGARLSAAQRQKVGIARAVLKRPDILLLAEAGNALDGASQAKVVANLLKEFKGRGLVWGLSRARFAKDFDLVLVMRAGRVVEQGTFEQLNRSDTALKELLSAE